MVNENLGGGYSTCASFFDAVVRRFLKSPDEITRSLVPKIRRCYTILIHVDSLTATSKE